MRPLLPFAISLAVATAALAEDLPDGVGVATPSGSVFSSEVSQVDIDDYVIRGYRGMTVGAIVRRAKHSPSAPELTVDAPGDGYYGDVHGHRGRRSSSVKFTIDETGIWKLRVGWIPQASAYSLTVKTSPPRLPVALLDAPDVDGRFRFTIPAEAGARIGWSLKTTGGTATFHSFLDPRGRPVTGLSGGASVTSFQLPAGAPFGDYTLTFDAPSRTATARLAAKVTPPKGPRRRVARLSPDEPAILTGDSVVPTAGGPGTVVTVLATRLVDENARKGAVGLFLGAMPLADVTLLEDGVTVRGTVPADPPEGVFDVVVTSTSGQPAARAAGFEIVARPVLDAIEPAIGSTLGGTEVTLSGRQFRDYEVGVLLDGVLLAVPPMRVDPTTLRFWLPPHAPGTVTIGVRDTGSGLESLTTSSLEFVPSAAVVRVEPPLVPVLSGDAITLEGFLFSASDRVFLETTSAGVFDELTASQATFVDASHHRFTAPLRPKGEYGVYVEDATGRRSSLPKTLAYFSIADVTAASGLSASGPDAWDATSTALADVDRDGDLDLVLARRGGPNASTTSETRVLANDGHGAFTDVTASTMPPAGADDWRADRVVAADLDGDGFTDLVLATNSVAVPPAGSSHTRLLLNEPRGGAGAGAGTRVLRDRTGDLMAPPRRATYFKYLDQTPLGGTQYVADDWRGLDVWVGDLDANGSGRPEILLVHDETKTDNGVQPDGKAWGVECGNYCPWSFGYYVYSYALYWGGSRAFTWDKTARGGLGRYRFESKVFPASANWIGVACGTYPVNPCPGTFTPFTGKRIEVADIDHDDTPDVAVLSDHPVPGAGQWFSALQVGLQKFDAYRGTRLTDVTPALTALGYDLSGDALAIGSTGVADGNHYGTIAVGWSQFHPGRSLTLLQFVPRFAFATFDDVTLSALPAGDADDGFQASQIRFTDADQDGDDDLLLLAPTAPGGTKSAFRLLRNDRVGDQRGVFRRVSDTLTDPLQSPTEHLEGDALAIGDVTGDGLLDYVVTRSSPTNPGSATRMLVPSK